MLATPVLTAAQMREADRVTIEDFGIPSHTLMESASRAAARIIIECHGPVAGKHVVLCCGKGNNGGDGLVVARSLYAREAHVTVITLAGPEAMTPDTALNYRLLERLQVKDEDERLRLIRYTSPDTLHNLRHADLFVDALLGTGLTKAVRGPIASLVAWMNDQSTPTVAIDIPTGLHADTGQVLGGAIHAENTVTMAALKRGLMLGQGPRYTGKITTVDIGIPDFALQQAQGYAPTFLTTDAQVQQSLPKRSHDVHKFSAGLAVVIGGSLDFTGAPVMAATATARAGAGYVVCAAPASVQFLLATKLTEIPVLGLPIAASGGIDPAEAFETITPRLEKAQALLVGCGLGREASTQTFVRQLLTYTDLPTVIDADGLNALIGHTDILVKHAKGNWLLTPHAGEFRRLAGADVDLIDRVHVARTYAKRWNCVLMLKGLPSVVGCPDGTVYINSTGNSALATAGTGDVLAGLCAGFLAQGLSAKQAAVCALHVGGAVADHYVRQHGASTMLATDLLMHFPLVLKERFGL